MRKILFFAALALFAMTSINAQEETLKEINFGVKAGVNFTNIHTRGGSNGASGNIGNAKTGFHIGAVAEIMLNRRFALQAELLFSAQGTELTGIIDSELTGIIDSGNTISLNYINVPLMAKFYVVKGLFIEAGPQIGFLVSSEYKSSEDFDPNSIDFGANFGLGYKLKNGLNFSARFNQGLSGTNINYFVNIFDDAQTNRVIQLSAGYMF
jgi:hypothetical protein